jgi:drug/metabolite transporter (DMT)-like permease
MGANRLASLILGSEQVMAKQQDKVPSRVLRDGSGPRAALVFAAGAVALWSTNALVGKSLLASHPVSLVQFLQFTGAALVFALIRLIGRAFPSPLVGPEGRASPVARPGGGSARSAETDGWTERRRRQAGTPLIRRLLRHLLPQGEKVEPTSFAAVLVPLAVGIVGLVGTMVLQYVAFASMPVIEANLVAYTWPLMVAAAVIVLGSPRRPALLGVTAVLGFVGVVLVISGGRDQSWFQGSLTGYLAAFGSALCMAFYSIAVGRLATSADRLLLPSALAGVALTLLWCLHDGVAWQAGAYLIAGLYLGAGPMGLGYYFWSQALRLDRGGKVAVVAYLTPIASTFLLTLSGERLTMTAIAGAVLVIGSCIAVGIEGSEAENHA